MGWLRLVGSLKLQVSYAEYKSLLQGSFAKETYNFKEPTNRSQPILLLLLNNHSHALQNQNWQTQRVNYSKNSLLFLHNQWQSVSLRSLRVAQKGFLFFFYKKIIAWSVGCPQRLGLIFLAGVSQAKIYTYIHIYIYMYVYIYIRTQVFRKNIHTQAFRIFQENCAHTRVYCAQNVCTQRFILAQNVCIEL